MTAFEATSGQGNASWHHPSRSQVPQKASGVFTLENVRAVGESLKMTRQILEGIAAKQAELKAQGPPRQRYFETDEWKLKIQVLLAYDPRSNSERDVQCILFQENYKLFKNTMDEISARKAPPGSTPPLSFEDLMVLGQQYKTMISYHPLLGDYANRIYAQHLGHDAAHGRIHVDQLFANLFGHFGDYIKPTAMGTKGPPRSNNVFRQSTQVGLIRPPDRYVATPPVIDNLPKKSDSAVLKSTGRPVFKPVAKSTAGHQVFKGHEDETNAAAAALMFLGRDGSGDRKGMYPMLGARGGVSKVRGKERPLSRSDTQRPSHSESLMVSQEKQISRIQKSNSGRLQNELLSILALSKGQE